MVSAPAALTLACMLQGAVRLQLGERAQVTSHACLLPVAKSITAMLLAFLQ